MTHNIHQIGWRSTHHIGVNKMKKYEVQTLTNDGRVWEWSNTLSEDDQPLRFDTQAEAEDELKFHLSALKDAWENGLMEEEPNAEDFRIEQVYLKQTTYTVGDIQDIADEALNAACRAIQDRLGVPNGDLAAHYFQGHAERVIDDILRGYIRTEIQAGEEQ